MPDVKIFSEDQAQKILQNIKQENLYSKVYLNQYSNVTDWDTAFAIGRSGVANKVFSVGDQLMGTYTVDETVYGCPWDVLGFRDVTALVDGEEVVYHNAPIIQMHYCGHQSIPFDLPEAYEATEATAQEGFYYCGYDGTNYTMLGLSTGDAIPYETYTKVYKTLYNSVNAIQFGNSEWQYSLMRQFLHAEGTGWITKQHECDVLPSNAADVLGFMSYLDADLVRNLHPVKVYTKQATYTGGQLIETWDKLYLLSVSEMNMQNSNASSDDGEPLEYYKQLLESETKIDVGTYPALIKYAVNNQTTALNVRLRSAYVGYVSVWYVNSSGNVVSYNPSTAIRPAPACALV